MHRQPIALGGGCFWCTGAVYELVDGVLAGQRHDFANHPTAGGGSVVVGPKLEQFRRTFRSRLKKD